MAQSICDRATRLARVLAVQPLRRDVVVPGSAGLVRADRVRLVVLPGGITVQCGVRSRGAEHLDAGPRRRLRDVSLGAEPASGVGRGSNQHEVVEKRRPLGNARHAVLGCRVDRVTGDIPARGLEHGQQRAVGGVEDHRLAAPGGGQHRQVPDEAELASATNRVQPQLAAGDQPLHRLRISAIQRSHLEAGSRCRLGGGRQGRPRRGQLGSTERRNVQVPGARHQERTMLRCRVEGQPSATDPHSVAGGRLIPRPPSGGRRVPELEVAHVLGVRSRHAAKVLMP